MSDIESNLGNAVGQLDIGPEVCRCKLLSGAQTLQSQGFLFGSLLYYVLYPIVIMPFLALATITFPLFILGKMLGHTEEEMLDMAGPPVIGIAFLFLYLVFLWFAYIWPRSDQFTLHEKGIRIRFGFQKLFCSFESIQGIFVGRAPSKVEGGMRTVLAVLKPGEADWHRHLDDTAITIVMTDGTMHVFKAFSLVSSQRIWRNYSSSWSE